MAKHVADIVIACVLFTGAVYLWFVADGFPRFARYRDIDSDFWPKALMVLIAGLALVLLVQSIQALRLELRGPQGTDDAGSGGAETLIWGRLVFAAALTIAYVLALRFVGFLLATVVFLAIAQNVVAYANLWVKIAFPFVFTGVMAFLFVKVMGLSLPRGVGVFYQFSLNFY